MKVLAGLANGRVSSAFVVQPGIGPFSGLDARDAGELGELPAFLGDWLASDPDRLDASLSDFVGVPGYVGAVCKVDELRADKDRFARMLLGYDWGGLRFRVPDNVVGELRWGRMLFQLFAL